MRGRAMRAATIATVAILLSGCRVFFFDSGSSRDSTNAVTITNPTADRFFLRVELYGCEPGVDDPTHAGPYTSLTIGDYTRPKPVTTINTGGKASHVCYQADQYLNGLVFDQGEPSGWFLPVPNAAPGLFVLEPGASITLTATSWGTYDAPPLPFDVYGDWCGVVEGRGQCFDIVRFT
jgi:hypothetical protein